MMFKVIPMHTKPLKHTKNMQILTNYIKQTRCFENFLQKSTFRNVLTTPEVIICAKDAPRCPGLF